MNAIIAERALPCLNFLKKTVLLAGCCLFLITSCKKEELSTATSGSTSSPEGAPLITKLNLTEATSGTRLEIEGSNFTATLTNLKVMIDSVQATVLEANPNKVSIKLPELSPGVKKITVKVGTKISNAVDLTYTGPVGEAGNEGYYLNQGNIELHYLSTSGDETTEHVTRLTGISDSAGGKIYRIRTEIKGSTFVTGGVLTNSNFTVYTSYLDGALAEMAETLKSDPDISGFILEGIPNSITMTARPAKDQPVTFSSPVHMAWTSHVGDIAIHSDLVSTSSNGKIIGFEDVLTPAGSFTNCLKWTYHTKIVLTGSGASTTIEEDHTMWYAKGLGPVKDITTGTNGITTSQLTEIKNKTE